MDPADWQIIIQRVVPMKIMWKSGGAQPMVQIIQGVHTSWRYHWLWWRGTERRITFKKENSDELWCSPSLQKKKGKKVFYWINLTNLQERKNAGRPTCHSNSVPKDDFIEVHLTTYFCNDAIIRDMMSMLLLRGLKRKIKACCLQYPIHTDADEYLFPSCPHGMPLAT